ncbi:FHA domain-containing serine/threonine-protein kinase [Laspinema olomoucense]|uniref:FHA domain-containing serine/threonine-protein kinase n=1 Tax=Laspinema olomoucense TaxID=3231600 RepID=UPI0021BAF1EA|nr:FHA domain-containing serine/threonine-protein kinase [Laspinema sp. D3c]MCT7994621.1 serine/threonine-protein kinase [Laspinema sp. D3c]
MMFQGVAEVVTLVLVDDTNSPIKQWRFENAEVIRIGRSPEQNDLVLDDPVVSRLHLELHLTQDSTHGKVWQLINYGTNGTFVNGHPAQQSRLSNGALIQLARGGPLLKFILEVQASPSPPASPASPVASVCTHANNPPHTLFCIHCGAPIHVERQIREYQVLKTLGQGGMGTTYLAFVPPEENNPRPQMLVLKEMNADMTRIPKARELFEREARILKGLNHPGVPQFYDFFVDEGKKYLAMAMIHGQDLEQRVYQRGPVVLSQAIEWMIQTCEVLEYIHAQSPPIVHRDIKPANLMVRTVDNRIIVLDFGAVKEIGTPLGTCIGAPDYTAPEQNRGEPLTQSDLYAIGATLIFLLTGESPQKFFELRGSGYGFNLKGDPRIPPQVRETIEKATESKPSDRYQTAAQLARALSQCL